MRYREFFAGVHDHVFEAATLQALDALDAEPGGIDRIRSVCESVGARLVVVAAARGWLTRLDAPAEYVDITQPNDEHATINTGDPEALCAFALWRASRAAIRTKVVVPPARYRPGRAPWQLEASEAAVHPHHRDD